MSPKNPTQLAVDAVKNAIWAAYEDAVEAGTLPSGAPDRFDISEPREKGWGDLAANFALVWAGVLNVERGKIAQEVASRIRLGGTIGNIQVAGPGFVNVELGNDW